MHNLTIGAGGDYQTPIQALNDLYAAITITDSYTFTLISNIHDPFSIVTTGMRIQIGNHDVIFRNPNHYSVTIEDYIFLWVYSNGKGKFIFDGMLIDVDNAIIPAIPIAVICNHWHDGHKRAELRISNCKVNCKGRWDYGIELDIDYQIPANIVCINIIVSGAMWGGINATSYPTI